MRSYKNSFLNKFEGKINHTNKSGQIVYGQNGETTNSKNTIQS